VRPATPTSIYPARYLTPQPPEGPREWACALGFIEWPRLRVIDLRPSFLNLVSASACCRRLTLNPMDLVDTSLEEWIESIERSEEPIVIYLRPGRYLLEKPVRLRKEHSRLTIEAFGDGAVEFAAAPYASSEFREGLLQAHEAHDVTIRGLRFLMPATTFEELITEELLEFSTRTHSIEHAIFWQLRELRRSVGLTLAHCAHITIEKCGFTLPSQVERGEHACVFGACIFGAGHIRGLQVRDCAFEAAAKLKDDARHLLFGYLQVPPASQERELLGEAKAERYEHAFMNFNYRDFPTSITEASFCRNSFTKLTAAALVLGDVGRLCIEENSARDCYGGFWLFALGARPYEWKNLKYYVECLSHILADRYVYWPLALARCLSLPWFANHREQEQLRLELQVRGNSVEAQSVAFISWHTDGSDGVSVSVNGNRLTSQMYATPTGAVVNARYGTLVGNILLNHAEAARRGAATAFVVAHDLTPCDFAATGNVHEGALRLP
jgi:hypothetical protein